MCHVAFFTGCHPTKTPVKVIWCISVTIQLATLPCWYIARLRLWAFLKQNSEDFQIRISIIHLNSRLWDQIALPAPQRVFVLHSIKKSGKVFANECIQFVITFHMLSQHFWNLDLHSSFILFCCLQSLYGHVDDVCRKHQDEAISRLYFLD